MIVFFIVFTIAIQNNMYKAQLVRNEQLAADVASIINTEAVLASQVHSGYTRTFTLPILLDGSEYLLELDASREDLFITFRGEKYLFFLDAPLPVADPADLQLGSVTISS